MPKGNRQGKQEKGSHRYKEGSYLIEKMGDERWYVYDGNEFQGSFELLRDARKFCRQQN